MEYFMLLLVLTFAMFVIVMCTESNLKTPYVLCIIVSMLFSVFVAVMVVIVGGIYVLTHIDAGAGPTKDIKE